MFTESAHITARTGRASHNPHLDEGAERVTLACAETPPGFLTLAELLGYTPPATQRWFTLRPDQWLHAMRQTASCEPRDHFGVFLEATYARSTCRDFGLVCQEWTLAATRVCGENPDEDDAYGMRGTGVCICGQTGLTKLYLLHNAVTAAVMVVGSHCVGNLAVREEVLTACDALDAFLTSEQTRLRAPGIALVREYGWIDDRTHDFLMNIRRKRKLSSKQADWERDIRRRVTIRLKRHGLCLKSPAEV